MHCCNTLAAHKKHVWNAMSCDCHIFDLDNIDELSVDNKGILIKRAHETTNISWHRMSIRGKNYELIYKNSTRISEAKLICTFTAIIILKLRQNMLIYVFCTNRLSNFYSSTVR
jgi:hypothetical protein